MVFRTNYIIRTPRGDYRVSIRRGSNVSSLDPEDARGVWHFFSYRIRGFDPSAVQAALDLREQLWGTRIELKRDQRDASHLREVCRQLEFAVYAGSVVFERVERRVSRSSPSVENSTQRTTPARAPAPQQVEAPTWFEVTVIDERGDPLGNVDLTFSAGGETQHVTTSPAGFARVEGTGSYKSVRILNDAKLKPVLDRRWLSWKDWNPSQRVESDHVFTLGTFSSMSIRSEEPSTIVVRAPRDHVSVLVIDEDGSPVSGRPYRLTLPTGAVLEGVTDDDGLVSVDETLTGDCNLTLW